MKRSTYIAAALTLALITGILLVMGLARQNPPSTDPTFPAPLASTPTAPSHPAIALASPTPIETQKSKIENPPAPLAFPLEPPAHDPAMIKQGDFYYVFYTGGAISEIRSQDLLHWENPLAPARGASTTTPAPPARGGRGTRPANTLPGMPNSVSAILPNVTSLWAPDIAFYKGKYLLYYAASTFGQRTSAIGLATNATLDPASRDYQWYDNGIVVRSQNSDNFNAIDPNFARDENGRPWLAFGSYWSGIKLLRLADDGKPDPADKTLYSIAARKAPETAVEAPFIIHEGKYFYLFVSWDRCCQGTNSTYRIMVGRAAKITGPYLDQDGLDMAQGGGTQLLAGDGRRIIGPGGQSLLKDNNRWLLVYHFYDANTNGTSRLQLRPLTFTPQAWPTLGKPLNSPE